MAPTAESNTLAEDRDVSRPKNLEPSSAETAASQFGGPAGNVFIHALSELSGNAGGLFDPTLSHPANGPVRNIALKRAQHTHGNHFVQRAVVQRKLSSSQTIQRECACGGTCRTCQASVAPTNQALESNRLFTAPVQTKLKSNSIGTESINESLTLPNGQGEALAEETRTQMESGFGTDFSDVRIHSDSGAAASAEAVGANAYSSGRDIYFAAGKYSPGSDEGKRLLAHELAHTIQQANTPSFAGQSTSGNLIIDPDNALEQEADRTAERIVSAAGAKSNPGSAAGIQSKTASHFISPRSVAPGIGVTPIQRDVANVPTQSDTAGREVVNVQSTTANVFVPTPMPDAMGTVVAVPGGKEDFNPGTIVNDLRRAIDQSDVEFAGYEATDPDAPYSLRKMKFHRKIDFDAVYKSLNDLSAPQVKIVRDLYAEKEGGRSLDNDLFEKGESGYPSNLTFNQRTRLQVLLRGTQGQAISPEASGYLRRFRPDLANRLQLLFTQHKLPPVRINQIERAALEIVHILSNDLDGPKRERLMALHRRPVEEIDILDAFYQAHTGVNLPVELSGKLEGLQLSRMYQLRSGNIPLADSFAIEDKRRAIAEFDRVRKEKSVIPEAALDLVVAGTTKSLDKQRQKLVDEIDQILALNRQEAMAEAEGTMTTAAEAVAERLKTVLGYGRDEAGRNVGDVLKLTLGEKKAAELTAITNASLIDAHARRLADTESRNATKPSDILAMLQELRAEARHDVLSRAADPWMTLEKKKEMLERVEEEVQSTASQYVGLLQSRYEQIRGEGRPWQDIVKSFEGVDEDEVNRMTSGAGVMTDAQELDLAIRRNKPDIALNVLKRQPTQEAMFDLRMKYFALSGKWLEESIYGYRWQRVATAEEASVPKPEMLGVVGGVMTGRNAALAAEQLEKPAALARGTVVEMEWVAASAEREFDVTWGNRGLTGRLREIGDDPETETIMRETRNEIRSLRQKWINSTDKLERHRILAEMKRWRATLTGDAAAYEADNKKMLDKIRSVVSIAVQLALAIALPGAGATFMGFVRATAMQIATSVASNVVIYGEDYSLAQLRGDIVGGVLGAAGGKLGEELVGGALAAKAAAGAKEARAVAGEIADVIAKPVANATAKGAAQVGIGTTIAKEAANQFGSMGGLTLATGENKFTLHDFFEGALMSGAGMVGKKFLGFDRPKPPTQAPERAGAPETPTPVAHPTETETKAPRAADEPTPAKPAEERPVTTPDVTREPQPIKAVSSDAELEASVRQSSQMDTITDQQAANEVAYIDKHPELPIEGTSPNQSVELGKHKVAEVPAGGCQRHSGGARKVDCPLRFLEELAKKPDLTEADIQALAKHLEIPLDEVRARFAAAARESTVQARAAMAAGGGIDVPGEGMNITSPMVRRPPSPKVPKPPAEVPLSKIAEQQLKAPLERDFPGGAWREQERFANPSAKPGEMLGSTVPEYFRPAPPEDIAFEVKRWDLEELGISPTATSHGTPSGPSVEVLSRTRQQLAARRENLPKGTTQCIVINVTGLGPGMKDRVALGQQLRDILKEHHINYDRIFIQDGDKLIEIK